MEPRLRWALNANICPFFIRDMRKEFPDYDLFCLDADALMLKKPELLIDAPRGYDFGAVFFHNQYYEFNQLCGGGLYFASTDKANELLDRWCEAQEWRNKELRDGIYKLPTIFPQDQETLQTLLQTIPDLKWIEFPPEYGYIEPTPSGKAVMPKVEDPVIVHTQASRTHRKKNPSKGAGNV